MDTGSTGKGMEWAVSSLTGSTRIFASFGNECIALAHGRGDIHADEAASLAAETAVWGYRQIRLRHFYWNDKKRLLWRIFKTTNLTLWQHRKRKQYDHPLPVSLAVCIMGDQHVWIGCTGGAGAMQIQGQYVVRLDEKSDPKAYIGVERSFSLESALSSKVAPGDTVIVGTPPVAVSSETTVLRGFLKFHPGQPPDALASAVRSLMPDQSGDMPMVAVVRRK